MVRPSQNERMEAMRMRNGERKVEVTVLTRQYWKSLVSNTINPSEFDLFRFQWDIDHLVDDGCYFLNEAAQHVAFEWRIKIENGEV